MAKRPLILPGTPVNAAKTTVYGNGTAMPKSDQKALNRLSILPLPRLPNDRFWQY
jgi:hypothetical protein